MSICIVLAQKRVVSAIYSASADFKLQYSSYAQIDNHLCVVLVVPSPFELYG